MDEFQEMWLLHVLSLYNPTGMSPENPKKGNQGLQQKFESSTKISVTLMNLNLGP